MHCVTRAITAVDAVIACQYLSIRALNAIRKTASGDVIDGTPRELAKQTGLYIE
jgi:hypothetical protein